MMAYFYPKNKHVSRNGLLFRLKFSFCPPRHIGDFAEVPVDSDRKFPKRKTCLLEGWGRGKLFFEQPIFTGVPM